ncbi:hypothetical protein [Lactococcus petauri]|uniref:hypothetical protein n=1 Tax=Lactococcus petauri TaxID=1940789 RepID=UPI0038539A7E
MIEVWIVTLLLIAFFIGAAWIWMRVWIIDIFKAINDSRNSKYSRKQWSFIWLFASFILLLVILAFIKWNINLF